jgi:hypothetical protein
VNLYPQGTTLLVVKSTLRRPAFKDTLFHLSALSSANRMTSTDEFGPLTATVNYGPLTTSFTPPPWCSTLLLYEYGEIEAEYRWFGFRATWGHRCTTTAHSHHGTYLVDEVDTSCFPEGWFSWSFSRTGTATTWAFSPGLFCPHGWTTAYTLSRHEGTTASFSFYDLEYMWEILEAGQTGVMCCPT